MTNFLDMHIDPSQQNAEVHDHIEIQHYKNQKNERSRLSSYLLNALYNSNTSFWSIAGIESLFETFELSIITWPLYLVAGIFTLGNLAYDIIVSTEQDNKHKSKVNELSNILTDEILQKRAEKLREYGYEIELVSYAKTNTSDTVLNDLIDDYFTALDFIDTQIANEELNVLQISQLLTLRNQSTLHLKSLSTQLHDQELAYRLNACINNNLNISTEEYNLPLLAQAYFWIARNFKTFTTGAITSTGATIFIATIFGLTLFSGFLPGAIIGILSIGIIGGITNYFLNKFYFDAAESEFEQRKALKNTLEDKSMLLKCKANLQALAYQSRSVTQHSHTHLPELELPDTDYVPREILKIEKPSQLRLYLFPILVGAFALYEGYSIAYNLIAPFIFVGLQTITSAIPYFGIALALLHASKKIIEYLDANKAVDDRYKQLMNIIPQEKVQLWQHKLRLAGDNTNVADLIYNASRKELIALLEAEYINLTHMLEQKDTDVEAHIDKIHNKINKHLPQINSNKYKTKILKAIHREDETEEADIDFTTQLFNFCRQALDSFEANWSDAFEGASTICALAAATLFLLLPTPAIGIIIPVLVLSFIIGGLGTILFQTYFENSTQYSMMNIKNTEKKLEDKVHIYKILQSTLMAQATLEQETTNNNYQNITSSLSSNIVNEKPSSSTMKKFEFSLKTDSETKLSTNLFRFNGLSDRSDLIEAATFAAPAA